MERAAGVSRLERKMVPLSFFEIPCKNSSF